MGPTLSTEASAMEQQFLHDVHDWESQTGVANPSFQRLHTEEQHGFTRLTYEISASGPMPAVSGLLYLLETSPTPHRIENVQMRPKVDTGDEIQIHINVSILCHGSSSQAPPAGAQATAAGVGE
jgi:hypothetical protein